MAEDLRINARGIVGQLNELTTRSGGEGRGEVAVEMMGFYAVPLDLCFPLTDQL